MIFLHGVGVACVIFTTGLLLAMGWHAGIVLGAYLFGAHRTVKVVIEQSSATERRL